MKKPILSHRNLRTTLITGAVTGIVIFLIWGIFSKPEFPVQTVHPSLISAAESKQSALLAALDSPVCAQPLYTFAPAEINLFCERAGLSDSVYINIQEGGKLITVCRHTLAGCLPIYLTFVGKFRNNGYQHTCIYFGRIPSYIVSIPFRAHLEKLLNESAFLRKLRARIDKIAINPEGRIDFSLRTSPAGARR